MTAPVLRVRDLHVEYAGETGVVPAVRGIDFDVQPGEVVAVVGESGSGKSTTAHALVRLLDDTARITAGRITIDGVDVLRLGERALNRLRGGTVGFVPQDPMVSLNPAERIGDQIREVLRIHGIARGQHARDLTLGLLEKAALGDAARVARQRPHELSGGMLQRALIALALAADPILLIADEPTSALDVTVQRQVLDHLQERTSQAGVAVLLVTHDLGVAADRADRILVLHDGRIVEQGPTDQVLDDPQHDYTRELLRSAPGLAFAGRVPPAAEASVPAAPPPIRLIDPAERAELRGEPVDGLRPGRLPEAPAAPADVVPADVVPIGIVPIGGVSAVPTPVAEGRGLTKDFTIGSGRRRTTFRAVDDVDVVIGHGRTVAVVGESGSGKTTLARMILRLEQPTQGQVLFGGQDITDVSGERLRRLRRSFQVVYQNPYASLQPRFTVEQIVTEPLRHYRIGDAARRRRRAAQLLDRVALPTSFLERRPAELSGGQRQRVAIARALALDPELMVCDEPVSALDVTVQAQILELLGYLQEACGLSFLFISHDLAVVRDIAHEVLVMHRGKVVERGPTADVLDHPREDYTRRLVDAIPGRRRRTTPLAGPPSPEAFGGAGRDGASDAGAASASGAPAPRPAGADLPHTPGAAAPATQAITLRSTPIEAIR